MKMSFKSTSAASVTVVLVIFSSFALHAAGVPHTHNSAASHDHAGEPHNTVVSILNEYMHTTDKKLLFVLPPAVFLFSSLLAYSFELLLLQLSGLCALVVLSRKKGRFDTFEHLAFLFSRGILHTKLH